MKGVPSSPIQCIGPSCTKRPTAVNKLEKKIEIRGVEVDEIYNCAGHGGYVDRITMESGVNFNRAHNPKELIDLQNEALERGTVRGISLPMEMKKQIGKWRESRHRSSPEEM